MLSGQEASERDCALGELVRLVVGRGDAPECDYTLGESAGAMVEGQETCECDCALGDLVGLVLSREEAPNVLALSSPFCVW